MCAYWSDFRSVHGYVALSMHLVSLLACLSEYPLMPLWCHFVHLFGNPFNLLLKDLTINMLSGMLIWVTYDIYYGSAFHMPFGISSYEPFSVLFSCFLVCYLVCSFILTHV